MAGLDNNVIFLLRGDEFQDSSPSKTPITTNTLTSSQIVQENNAGVNVKCIDFNNTNYMSFTLDSTFLKKPFTIDWWEKDAEGVTNSGTSALFTNVTGATKTMSFAISTWNSPRTALACSSDNSSWDIVSSVSIAYNIYGRWVHRAVVFDGKSYKAYEDGTLLKTFQSSKTCYTPLNTFQMGRWRQTGVALNKKIYNFRISNIVRWTENFTPQVEPYEEHSKIEIDELSETATLQEVADKLKEIALVMASKN